MSTTSRRVSAARRAHRKHVHTTSSRATIYIAVPPKTGWPAFTGGNWAELGLKMGKRS